MMSAIVTVAVGLAVGLWGILLMRRRGWRAMIGLTLLVCGPLVALVTLPQAWVAVAGRTVPGVVAELDERAGARQRRGWWGESRTFHVRVCYRLPEPLGLGVDAPLAPYAGEDPMSRACATLPGSEPARLTRARYAEADYDDLRIGMPAPVQVALLGGLVELAYPIEAPVLPWLPRPWSGAASGPTTRARAEVVTVTIQERGVSRGGGSGGSLLPVPIAHVQLRFTPPGFPAPVQAIDQIDADWRPELAQGAVLDIAFAAGAPRDAWIEGAGRRHRWRNALDYLLMIGTVALAVAALLIWAHRRRRKPAV